MSDERHIASLQAAWENAGEAAFNPDDITIELVREKTGGQHVGVTQPGWRVTHWTGVQIIVPPNMAGRSQYKTREAILACMEMLVEDLDKRR